MDIKFKVFHAPSGAGWMVRGLRPVFDLPDENLVLVPYDVLPHINPKIKICDVLQSEDIICTAATIRRDIYEFKRGAADEFLDFLQDRRQVVVARAASVRA